MWDKLQEAGRDGTALWRSRLGRGGTEPLLRTAQVSWGLGLHVVGTVGGGRCGARWANSRAAAPDVVELLGIQHAAEGSHGLEQIHPAEHFRTARLQWKGILTAIAADGT
jgi:hypothetical protein